jgi:acyl-CoA thioesterase-1
MSLRFVGALVVVLLPMAWRPAAADPVQIVAVGASNTWGWGVGRQSAFPAQLEALLRAKGLEAHVINAGVVAATTAGMLRRIDSAAPPGTDLVILQPGGNDLRFFGTREQRAANIGAIERRLRERGIKLIVFDPVFPPEYFSFDRIHFTTAAHAQIAAELVPLVTAALQKSAGRPRPDRRVPQGSRPGSPRSMSSSTASPIISRDLPPHLAIFRAVIMPSRIAIAKSSHFACISRGSGCFRLGESGS